MIYPAHIRVNDNGEKIIQTVEEHCRATAEIAAHELETIGLRNCAYLAGLTHDMGKYTDAFSIYIHNSADGKPVVKGSVIHTFQAVEFFLKRYHKGQGNLGDLTAEYLAAVTGSHHGLFDCLDLDGQSGFDHRLNASNTYYNDAVDSFLKYCVSDKELDELFALAAGEIENAVIKICQMTGNIENDECYDTECSFYSGFLIRLLLSAIIEGDRRNTAEFEFGETGLSQPTFISSEEWGNILQKVEKKIFSLPCEKPIDIARKRISDICRNSAKQSGGIFKLNAPTGGGKTLSSLRFALAHAAEHGKKRIIFTSPLLSILEQNAKEIQKYVQYDDIILEHHSNVIKEENKDGKELFEHELLIQNWDSPIIITTMVQFLDTLFSGKTTCIRRFHSLCDSVIVIDEIQTVPTKMLSMFSLAVNFLAEVCGASIVLCSATQPCLEHTEYPYYKEPRDILPYDEDIWKVFRRTEIKNAGSMSLEEIPSFAEQILDTVDSLLIICNKKSEAETIFSSISKEGRNVYYLSASLCTEHRRNVIKELKEKVEIEKAICISTQVIEAGVDISFDCVIRLSAGMDSIIQAAGRCNRHQKFATPVPVYVVDCKGEKLSMLRDIQRGKDATSALLTEYIINPEKYDSSLDSDKSIEYYYHQLYESMENGYRDYPTNINGRNCSLLSLLSLNKETECNGYSWILRHALKTAGVKFSVFDNNTTDVICSYGEGKMISDELMSDRASNDLVYSKELIEKAKAFTISLYSHEFSKMEKEGAIFKTAVGAYILLGHYNKDTGFDINEGIFQFMEV